MDFIRRRLVSNILRLRYARQGRPSINVLGPEAYSSMFLQLNEPGETLIYIGHRKQDRRPYAVVILKGGRDKDDFPTCRGFYIIYLGTTYKNVQAVEAKYIYKHIGGKYNFDRKGIINLQAREDGLHDYGLLLEFLTDVKEADLYDNYCGCFYLDYVDVRDFGLEGFVPPSCASIKPLRLAFDQTYHDGNSIIRGERPRLETNNNGIIILHDGHWYYGLTIKNILRGAHVQTLSILVGHKGLFRSEDEFNTIKSMFQRCLKTEVNRVLVSRCEEKASVGACASDALQYIAALVKGEMAPHAIFYYHLSDADACKLKNDPIVLLGKQIMKSMEETSDFSQSVASSQSQPMIIDDNWPEDNSILVVEEEPFQAEEKDVEDFVEVDMSHQLADVSDTIEIGTSSGETSADDDGLIHIQLSLSYPTPQRLLQPSDCEVLSQKAQKDIMHNKFFSFPSIRLRPWSNFQMERF